VILENEEAIQQHITQLQTPNQGNNRMSVAESATIHNTTIHSTTTNSAEPQLNKTSTEIVNNIIETEATKL